MGLDPKQFHEYVLLPVLRYLSADSQAARALLLGTALKESGGLTYLHQLGNGPALGLFQMEPFTHDDIWKTFLRYKPALAQKIRELAAAQPAGIRVDSANGDNLTFPAAGNLIGNMFYATAMSRMRYFRVSEALPAANDSRALCAYWKKHYNTSGGAGDIVEAEHYFAKAVTTTSVLEFYES